VSHPSVTLAIFVTTVSVENAEQPPTWGFGSARVRGRPHEISLDRAFHGWRGLRPRGCNPSEPTLP
jgi:hypothetical protein